MEHVITEEEIARYRLPECFEYFEEARFFQYFTVRICLALFGPGFTRSIAEYFHFEKSKYPVYNDDEIRKLILQTKRPKLITPTPKRLVGNIEEQRHAHSYSKW